MIGTASPYLTALLAAGKETAEGIAFPMKRVTDPSGFEAKFLELFEQPLTAEEPYFRIEEDGVLLAWLNYTTEDEDGTPTPAILFKKVDDPTEFIGYNPADLFENQIRQLAEYGLPASSILNPARHAGRVKSVVGGYRFTVGQRQKRDRDRALHLDAVLTGRRAARRGLASRIRKAKSWHQSYQGKAMHAAQAQYQKNLKSSCDKYKSFLQEHLYRRFHKGLGLYDFSKAIFRVEEQPVHLRAFQTSGLDLALGEAHAFVFDKQNRLHVIPAESIVRHAALRESSILYRFPDKETRDRVHTILYELGFEVLDRDENGMWLRFLQSTEVNDALRIVRTNGGKEIELTDALVEKEFATVIYQPELGSEYSIAQYRDEFGKDPWSVRFFFNKDERIKAAREVLKRLRADLQSGRSRLFRRSYGRRGDERVRLYKHEGKLFELSLASVLDGPGEAKATAGYHHDAQVSIGSDKGMVPVEVKNTHKAIFRATEIAPEETRSEPSDVFVVRHPSAHAPDNFDQIDVYVPDTKSFYVGSPEGKGEQVVRRTYANINRMKLIGTVHEDPDLFEDLDELTLHYGLLNLAETLGYDTLEQMPCGMVYVERQSGEVVVSVCEHLLDEAQVAAIRNYLRLPSDFEVEVFEDHYDPKRMLRECALSVLTEGDDIVQVGPRNWLVDGKRFVLYSPLSGFIRSYPLTEIFGRIKRWLQKKMPKTFGGKKPEQAKPAAKKPAAAKPPSGPKRKPGRPKMTPAEKQKAERDRERAAYAKGVAKGIKHQRKQAPAGAKTESVELVEFESRVRVYDERFTSGGPEVFKSLRSLVKYNNGLWKSDRQGDFLLNTVKRYGKFDNAFITPEVIRKYAPEGTLAIIYAASTVTGEQFGKHFGSQSRFLEYTYFLDANGVIREMKTQFKYTAGAASPEGFTITFERPEAIAKSLAPAAPVDTSWFTDNAEKIKKVMDVLQGDKYYEKDIEALQAGEKPDERRWLVLVREMEKRTAGYPPFSTTPVQMQIKLKVNKVKDVEREYGRFLSESYAFLGDVEGFSEFGYINIGYTTANKVFTSLIKPKDELGDPLSYVTTEQLQQFVVGKTLTLKGTFNSNGKMIFGKRVTILRVDESAVNDFAVCRTLTDVAIALRQIPALDEKLFALPRFGAYTVRTLDSGLFDLARKVNGNRIPLGVKSFGEVLETIARAGERKELTEQVALDQSLQMDAETERRIAEEHAEFLKWADANAAQLEEGVIDWLRSVPSMLKSSLTFLKDLATNTGFKISSLITLFRNTWVYKLFAYVGWNFKKLYDILKMGFKAYNSLLDAVAKYLADTKVAKWTEDELRKLDAFLQKHPVLRRLGGIAITALLLYIWFNMADTGNPAYDFDASDLLTAITGHFTLAELFAGKEGAKMLLLFATGMLTNLTFPWPGPGNVMFAIAILTSLARMAKTALTKATADATTEAANKGELTCA